jgi:hypothetical protein
MGIESLFRRGGGKVIGRTPLTAAGESGLSERRIGQRREQECAQRKREEDGYPDL